MEQDQKAQARQVGEWAPAGTAKRKTISQITILAVGGEDGAAVVASMPGCAAGHACAGDANTLQAEKTWLEKRLNLVNEALKKTSED